MDSGTKRRPGTRPAVISAGIAAMLLAGWTAATIVTEAFDYDRASRALTLILGLAAVTWLAAPVGALLGIWGMIAGARAGRRRIAILAAAGLLINVAAFAYTLAP